MVPHISNSNTKDTTNSVYTNELQYDDDKQHTIDSELYRLEHNDSPSTVLPQSLGATVSTSSFTSRSSIVVGNSIYNDDVDYYNNDTDTDGIDDDDDVTIVTNNVKHESYCKLPKYNSGAVTRDTSSNNTISTIGQPFFIFNDLIDIDPNTLLLVQQELQHQKHRTNNNCTISSRDTTVEINPQIDKHCIPANETKTAGSMTKREAATSATTSENAPSMSLQQHQSCLEPLSLQLLQIPDVSSLLRCLPHSKSSVLSFSSQFFYQRSIRIMDQYNEKGMTASSGNDLNCTNWKVALRNWLSASTIWDQLRSTHSIDTIINNPLLILVSMYNNIGVAYGFQQQYENAIKSLHYALQVGMNLLSLMDENDNTDDKQKQYQYTMNIVTIVQNIGLIFQQHNQPSVAIQYFVECKVLLEEIKLYDHYHCRSINIIIARTCIAIGNTYAMAHAYYDANEAFDDAVSTLNTTINSACICTDQRSDIESSTDDSSCEEDCKRLLRDIEKIKLNIREHMHI